MYKPFKSFLVSGHIENVREIAALDFSSARLFIVFSSLLGYHYC
jgi:hypothetical protein